MFPQERSQISCKELMVALSARRGGSQTTVLHNLGGSAPGYPLYYNEHGKQWYYFRRGVPLLRHWWRSRFNYQRKPMGSLARVSHTVPRLLFTNTESSSRQNMSEIPERFAGIRMRRVQPAQEAEVEQNTENPRFPGIRMRQIKPAEPATEVEQEVKQEAESKTEPSEDKTQLKALRNRAAKRLGELRHRQQIWRPPWIYVLGINLAQSNGVNPSVETIWNWHTCRSMIFPSQTCSSPSG